MSERPPDDSIENELERTLAEDLDGVSPRRNLWPDIAAAVDMKPPRSLRRWLIPALGSAAAVVLIVVVLPVVLRLELGCPVCSEPVAYETPADAAMQAALEPLLASGCTACHTIDSVPQARGQIGPNLSRVGAKGADYIRESILDPDAVIAAECPAGACPSGVMPQTFGVLLTQEEIDAIVTFLLEQQPPDFEVPVSLADFEVPVSLSEWAVTADASVGNGEVRFEVTNDGGTVHQLAVYQGGSLVGDSIEGGTLVARTGNIQAGGTVALEASLEPGDYWLVCPITGHTAAGMNAQLTVHAP